MWIRLGLLVTIFFYTSIATAAQYIAGDLAPRGVPDGVLDVSDVLVLERLVSGQITPTAIESIVGDVAPVGSPDNQLNVADILVLERAIRGKVTLAPITILPPSPILNSATTPTTQNPYPISGTASPEAMLYVYVNGIKQHQITANAIDGTFSINVYLYDGINNLHVTEFDGTDESVASNNLVVEYTNTIDRLQSGTIIEDSVWTPGSPAQPYSLTANLSVDPGAKLILMPGTTVQLNTYTFTVNGQVEVEAGSRIESSGYSTLNVYGNLTLKGTETEKVVLTSSQLTPLAGNWTGIQVYDGGNVTVDHAIIEYASYGVRFNLGSGGTVTNSTIRNNSYGIYATGSTVDPTKNPTPTLTNNGIFDNATNLFANSYANNEMTVIDATNNWWGTTDVSVLSTKIYDINDNLTYAPVINLGFITDELGNPVKHLLSGGLPQDNFILSHNSELLGNLTVLPGQTLTLATGNNLELRNRKLIIDGDLVLEADSRIESDAYSYIYVYGNLTANGTSIAPVIFTSSRATPAVSNWYGIRVYDGGTATLDNAVIEYARYGVFYGSGTGGAVTNSTLMNNQYALYTQGLTSDPLKSSLPNINQNRFENNTSYHLYTNGYANNKSTVINAKNNWWGTTDTSIIGSKIYDIADNVTYSPVVDFGFINDDTGAPVKHVLGGGLPQDNYTLSTNSELISNLTVHSGQTLTIPEGIVLELHNRTLKIDGNLVLEAGSQLVADGTAKLDVYGNLTIAGTSTTPVELTSSRTTPAVANWNGIQVYDGGTVAIDYANITYATYGVRFLIGSGGTITNSELSTNRYGIYSTGSTTDPLKNPLPIVNNNRIYGNTTYAYYSKFYANNSTTLLNANNNWWGTTDATLIGNAIYDYSDYSTNSPIVDIGTILDEAGNPLNQLLGGGLAQINTTLSGAYRLSSNLSVQTDQTLTIATGAVLELHSRTLKVDGNLVLEAGSQIKSDGAAYVIVYGNLTIAGTSTTPVLLTSSRASPASGNWGGIQVYDGGTIAMDYANITYASYGVQFLPGSGGTITNSELSTNRYGIYSTGSTSDPLKNPLPVVNNNQIHNNTYYAYYARFYGNNSSVFLNAKNNWWGTTDATLIGNAIYDYSEYPTNSPIIDLGTILDEAGSPADNLLGGALSQTSTILNNTSALSSDLTIQAGQTLTLATGSVLELNNRKLRIDGSLVLEAGSRIESSANSYINIYGSLSVNGTVTDPVFLTSSRATPAVGNWAGIQVYDGGTVAVNYANISYAGNAVRFFAGSGGSITNSEISNSRYGIYATGDNVNVDKNPLPVVNNNRLHSNQYQSYRTGTYVNNSTVILNAHNNWWGSIDGTQIGNAIYDYVDLPSQAPLVDAGIVHDELGNPVKRILGGSLTSDIVTITGVNELSGNLTIHSGQSLTIAPGAVLQLNNRRLRVDGNLLLEAGSRIESNAASYLDVYGSLTVQGTSINRVVFTSNRAIPAVNNWNGINVYEGGSVTVNYADISYATYGVRFHPGSAGSITNSDISLNKYGIYTKGDTLDVLRNPLPILNNNKIHDNTQFAYYSSTYGNNANVILDADNNYWGTTDASLIGGLIYDFSDAPTSSPVIDFGTILDQNGVPQRRLLSGSLSQTNEVLSGGNELGGNLTVQVGQTLTLPSGTLLELNNYQLRIDGSLVLQAGSRIQSNGYSSIFIYGDLTVTGTTTEPVVLTSSQDAQAVNNWKGIEVYQGGTVDITNADISYANAAVRFYTGSGGSVSASTLSNNNYGIYTSGDSVDPLLNPLPIVNNNSILDNSLYNFYAIGYANNTNVFLGASENWWGTTDALQISVKVYDYTDDVASAPIVDLGIILDENGTPAKTLVTEMLPQANISLSNYNELGNNLVVQTGQTLTLTPGSVLELNNKQLLIEGELILQAGSRVQSSGLSSIDIYGDLSITGSAIQPVELTSSRGEPAVSNWKGINVFEGGNISVDHAHISYASNAVRFYPGSGGSITNSELTLNQYGIYTTGDNIDALKNPLPVVNNNKIYSNSAGNYYAFSYVNNSSVFLDATSNWWGSTDAALVGNSILDYVDSSTNRPVVNLGTILDENSNPVKTLYGGLLTQDVVTMAGLNELTGLLTVQAGQTLTVTTDALLQLSSRRLRVDGSLVLNAGSRIESSATSYIDIYGDLQVNGVENNEVVLTSSRVVPAMGNWDGIRVRDGGNASVTYMDIQYANMALRLDAGSSATVTKSNITNNSYGVYALNGTLVEEKNPLLEVSNTNLFNNSNYNLYLSNYTNPSAYTINAKNNWWGALDKNTIGITIFDANDNSALSPNTNLYPILVAEVSNLTPPVISNSSEFTTQKTYTLSGSSIDGDLIEVYNDNVLVATTSLDVLGQFSAQVELEVGINSLRAVAVDGSGKSAQSNEVLIEHNPVSYIPVLNTGVSPVNSNPYTITGSALPNETINVYVNDVSQVSVISDAGGLFTASVTLIDGSNAIHATSRSGTAESPQSNVLNIVYDPLLLFAPITGTALLTEVMVPGTVYKVTSDVVIPTGTIFDIPEGAQLRFDPGVGLNVQGTGILNINGTAANPVLLTVEGDSGTKWKGITSSSYSENSVNISYATIENAIYGIEFVGSGSGSITHSHIRNNDVGVFIHSYLDTISAGDRGDFAGLNINDNNLYSNTVNMRVWDTFEYTTSSSMNSYYNRGGYDQVINARYNWWGSSDVRVIDTSIEDAVDGEQGEINARETGYVSFLPNRTAQDGPLLPGLALADAVEPLAVGTYYLSGIHKIASGQTLTFPAGSVVKASRGAQLRADANAILNVTGTASDPVVFTSIYMNPGAGDWGGIMVTGSSATMGSVNIDHAVIEYAKHGVEFNQAGMSNITNSDLRDNSIGVYVHGFIYSSNGARRGYFDNVVLNNNNIYNNGLNLRIWDTYLYSTSETIVSFYNRGEYDQVINARHNWWGSNNPDLIESSIEDAVDGEQGETNAREAGYVSFLPYQTSPDGPSLPGQALSDAVPPLTAGTYYVSGYHKVSGGTGELTIPAGSTLKSSRGATLRIENGATLNVPGTSTDPVMFTSFYANPGSGDWGGIVATGKITNPGTLNINHAVIEYADNGIEFNQIGVSQITNSNLRNNYVAVYVHGYTYSNTGGGRGYFDNVVLNNNNIYNNGANIRVWDTYQYSTNVAKISNYNRGDYDQVINARDNWWGTDDPDLIEASVEDAVDGEQGETNARETGYVSFLPYRTALDGSSLPGQSLSDAVQPLTVGTYYVSGYHNVIGSSLSIPAGSTLKFSRGAKIRVDSGAALNATGTATDPVVFTSAYANPGAGDWGGIMVTGTIDNPGTANIDHAVIEYAEYGIEFNQVGKSNITNSELRNNSVGVYAHGYVYSSSGARRGYFDNVVLNNNNIYNNGSNVRIWDTYQYSSSAAEISTYNRGGYDQVINARNNWWGSSDVRVIDTNIEDAVDGEQGYSHARETGYVSFLPHRTALGGPSLPGQALADAVQPLTAGTFYVSGYHKIASGVTLTLPAGSIVKASRGAQLRADANTILNVAGTAVDPVVFTSVYNLPAANDWGGIISTGTSSVLLGTLNIDHAVIEFAESAVEFNQVGKSNITNSYLRNNGVGVYAHGYTYSSGGGARGYFDNVVLNNNNIYNNDSNVRIWDTYQYSWNASNISAYNRGSYDQVINARHNWWGSSDARVIDASIEDAVDGEQGESTGRETAYVSFLPHRTAIDGPSLPGQALADAVQPLTADTYYLSGYHKVTNAESLNIPAGSVVKASRGAQLRADVNAIINVVGTEFDPVLFTSVYDVPAANDWGGINVSGTSSLSLGTANIDHAVIEYAGNALELNQVGAANVTNTDLRHNSVGVYVHGYSYSINSDARGEFQNVAVNQNNFYNNGVNARVQDTYQYRTTKANVSAYNRGTYDMVLNLRDNWWGSSDARLIDVSIEDAVDGEHGATNARETGYVSYLPYRTALDGPTIPGQSLSDAVQPLAVGTYYVSGYHKIGYAETLTIPAGSVIKASRGAQIRADSGAILNVTGTAVDPVAFTSVYDLPAVNDWGGIMVTGHNVSSMGTANIDYAVIQYAESGLDVNQVGVANLSNSDLHNNGVAVFLHGYPYSVNPVATGNFDQVSVANNNFYSNEINLRAWDTHESPTIGNDIYFKALNNWWGSNNIEAIASTIEDATKGNQGSNKFERTYIEYMPYLIAQDGPASGLSLSGTITDVQVLAAETYFVTTNVTVAVGGSLTIPAGATLKFTNGAKLTIDGGTLNVIGSVNNYALLTSVNTQPQQSDWYGIEVFANSTINIDYAIIEYAQYGIETHSELGISGSVTNSLLRGNLHAIYLRNDVGLIITGNTIVDNAYGILLNASKDDPQPTIHNNTLLNNSISSLVIQSYGYSSPIVLDIQNNWWGTATPDTTTYNSKDVYFSGSATTVAAIDSPAAAAIHAPVVKSIQISQSYLSPAGNSSINSTALTATLDHSADWVINVKDSTQTIVRTYSGVGVTVNATWDGLNTSAIAVSDGAYSIELTATSLNGVSLPVSLPTIVDSTLPVSDISDALNGVSAPAVLNVIGTATDTYLQSYHIEYGEGLAPLIFISAGAASTSSVLNNSLLNWATTDSSGLSLLPNGDHTLKVTVTDRAGNTATDQITVNFSKLNISNVSYSTTDADGGITIEPGLGELATVNFEVNRPVTAFIRWYTEDTETLVHESSRAVVAGAHSFTWNGKDNIGNDLPENAYIFKIYVTDGINDVEYYDAGTPRTIGFPGGTTTRDINIFRNQKYIQKMNVSNNCLSGCRVVLHVNDYGGYGPFDAFSNAFEANQQALVSWDLTDPNGQTVTGSYFTLLRDLTLLKPNSVIVKHQVTGFKVRGTGLYPELEVQSDPYMIIHSYEQFSKVEYHLDRSAHVKVTLLPPNITDVNDPSAIVIMPSTLQPASVGGTPYEFSWKGYEDAPGLTNDILVSEEGAYSYVIEATSEADGTYTSHRGYITMYQ